MRILALALLVLSPLAYAAPPSGIVLDDLKVSKGAATGMCGPAHVAISDVSPQNPSGERNLVGINAQITMSLNGRSIQVAGENPSTDYYLQDQNRLHCLATPKGPRVLVGGYCLARLCVPADYIVVDPNTLKVLSKPVEGACEEDCAKKALGIPLPRDLSVY
jgi:hypothetical protein